MTTDNRIISSRKLPDIRPEDIQISARPYKLNAILPYNHRQAGMSLDEDEDFLYLYHEGKRVAIWNSRAVTIIEILKEADRYLCHDLLAEMQRTGQLKIS
jgi:hypothetical protein